MNQEKREKDTSKKQLVIAFAFPLTAVMVLGVAIFLGYKLDEFLGTTPLFIIVFILCGIGTLYHRLIKTFSE